MKKIYVNCEIPREQLWGDLTSLWEQKELSGNSISEHLCEITSLLAPLAYYAIDDTAAFLRQRRNASGSLLELQTIKHKLSDAISSSVILEEFQKSLATKEKSSLNLAELIGQFDIAMTEFINILDTCCKLNGGLGYMAHSWIGDAAIVSATYAAGSEPIRKIRHTIGL